MLQIQMLGLLHLSFTNTYSNDLGLRANITSTLWQIQVSHTIWFTVKLSYRHDISNAFHSIIINLYVSHHQAETWKQMQTLVLIIEDEHDKQKESKVIGLLHCKLANALQLRYRKYCTLSCYTLSAITISQRLCLILHFVYYLYLKLKTHRYS